MKTIVVPKDKKQLETVIDNIDGYLVGLENMSVNCLYTLSLKELEKLLKENPLKECFLAINKNIKNEDLSLLNKVLKEIKDWPIKGILAADPAVLIIANEQNNKIPLVWSSEHAVTNAYTINYWLDQGYQMAFLANELMEDEIKTIRKKVTKPLFCQVFGYIPIFVSKRFLVSNYKNHFKLEDNSKFYRMNKEGISHIVNETTDGTQVFYGKVLNAYHEYEHLKQLGIDYAVFQGCFLEDKILNEALIIYQQRLGKEKIDMLLNYQTTTGFYHQEAIYRVKK